MIYGSNYSLYKSIKVELSKNQWFIRDNND